MLSYESRLKVFWYILLSFVFTISVSQYLSVRLLVLSLIISLGFSFKRNGFFRIITYSWDVFLYFIVLIIGLFYSSNISDGMRVLETSFSLLALPFVLSVFSVDKERIDSILRNFVLGLSIAGVGCISYAAYMYIMKDGNYGFLFEDLTMIIGSQPTYFAYYLCFALTTILYILYYENLKISNGILFGELIFLFILLMLSGARTAYVNMLFVFSFFILKFLFEESRTHVKKLVFGLSVSFLITMLLINHYNLNAPPVRAEGDYWERLSLWESAIDANPNFLLGIGTGDYKIVMNDYYRTHNLSQFASDSFNAHNQFLQTYFSNGLIGLIALLILIVRPLYLSVKYQNVLGILVFFSFIIYGMTEVFLGRYQGVVFFALLHQVFINFYYSRQTSFSLKEI